MDYFDSWEDFVIWGFVGLIVFIVLFGIGYCVKDDYLWNHAPRQEVSCNLLSQSVDPSTLQTHLIPSVATRGGMSFGVVTTGQAEQHITIWDCSGYGRVVSNNDAVFQYAKPISSLVFALKNNEFRIVGIK